MTVRISSVQSYCRFFRFIVVSQDIDFTVADKRYMLEICFARGYRDPSALAFSTDWIVAKGPLSVAT